MNFTKAELEKIEREVADSERRNWRKVEREELKAFNALRRGNSNDR